MSKMFKKLLATFLCITMILTAMPIIASAETTQENESDSQEIVSKSEREPYVVCELVEKRSEDTKHFLMSDRTVMAAVYNTAVHYKNGDVWEDIDNSFYSGNDNSTYENKKNSIKLKFAKKSGDDKELVTIKKR